MAPIVCTRRIEASPADVFEVVTDLDSATDRISAITNLEVLSDGPFGVGTRWRETRVMFRKEHTEEMWVTEFEPGRAYTTEAHSCGSVYHCTMSVEPDGTGSILAMTFDSRPMTFMAKLMSPLCFLFNGAMVKCIEKDFDDIQSSLEAPAGDSVTA
jgi:hypothetical protein